jgi:hypothetical protein
MPEEMRVCHAFLPDRDAARVPVAVRELRALRYRASLRG